MTRNNRDWDPATDPPVGVAQAGQPPPDVAEIFGRLIRTWGEISSISGFVSAHYFLGDEVSKLLSAVRAIHLCSSCTVRPEVLKSGVDPYTTRTLGRRVGE